MPYVEKRRPTQNEKGEWIEMVFPIWVEPIPPPPPTITISEQPCEFDNLSPYYHRNAMSLSCGCPKCSPRC